MGLDAEAIYASFFNSEPDSVSRNKTVTPSNPFLGLATGLQPGRELKVQVSPTRVDVITEMPSADLQNETDLPLMDLDAELDHLTERFAEAAATLPPAIRLSLLAHLWQQFPSHPEATKAAAERSGLGVKIDGHTDLSVQINKRIRILDNYLVNRIIKIGVAEVKGMILNPDADHAPLTVSQRYAATMLLDFNLVPLREPLPLQDQERVMSGLRDLVLDFAKSDHPIEHL